MTSIQERLQLKREPLDKWSTREQLCLASAVARSGDQNWMSVSRALKPFGESNRPADWFHQKNCAAQYGALLGNVETPKRKKRSGVETGVETPTECILKKLLAERKAELKRLLAEEKTEYQKLQEDMKLLQSGKVSEEQLDVWCKEIDAEEYKREQEALARDQWLKQRDLRKQEIERAWRPAKPPFHGIGQKRKISDTLDELAETESEDNSHFVHQHSNQQQYQHYQPQPQTQHQHQMPPQEINHQQLLHQELQQTQQQPLVHVSTHESAKPALSPLLTSLLKSPSQVQNVSSVSTSILHNAITNQSNQKSIQQTSNSSPTIASLLNTSAGITVSTGLQQLVSSALGQDVTNSLMNDDQSQPLDTNILDDANIKIEDLANSILDQDGPLPEIKKEEVDDIISEIIENAQDIVADPDQHLQLDGNGDININLELEDLEEEVISPEVAAPEEPNKEEKDDTKTPEKAAPPPPVIDPFEFQEDPVLFESPVKPSSMKQDNVPYVPLYQQQSPTKSEDISKKNSEKIESPRKSVEGPGPEIEKNEDFQSTKTLPGSVEIVEVVAEEHENEKELDKSQIEDIVHSNKEKEDQVEIKEEKVSEESKDLEDNLKIENEIIPEETKETKISENTENQETLVESQLSASTNEVSLSESNNANTNTLFSELADDLYDNINMEVKIDKTGKTKRDYSRTKKKEEKNFDMLLAIEKSQIEDADVSEDIAVEPKVENEKTDIKPLIKTENERSNSPWTEEEDIGAKGNKRRYSTPGTPLDSLPNSPASSTAYYDDDRDYKNWKKSVMLVYNRLASNKYASLFLKPITDDQAPGYSAVVYRPMDLQTIKKHIDNGIIRTSLEFKRDVMLMFTNAIMYNKTNDTIYNMALQMQQESMNPIEILLQAQSQVDTPIRRETRTSESSCKRKRVIEEPIKNKKRKEDTTQPKII